MSAAIPPLVNLRTRAGFRSSGALAKHLEVNRNTVDHWERARHIPDLLDAARWAAAIGTDLDTLARVLRTARTGEPTKAASARRAPSSPTRARRPSSPARGALLSGGSR